eukprot:TRINITY_DN20813_c0_g1_i1.p1 TRINITY_DN20813_c0_g1~~TRINITY_DN20813_c0_g1_i1.p1  ORF type:complete len:194 (-),score=47.95 TRINITY_DN20813_c0_g1_i1:189-770(-)
MPSLSDDAYATIALHALKFPESPVCGLLVGSAGAIERAYPLQHGHITLSPMLEVAFAQVDALLAEEAQGRTIVGWYQGNSHHDDRAIGDSGLRMASRIQGYCAGASLLVIRNQAMASLESEGLFAVHQWDTNRKEWKLVAEDEAAQSNKAVAKKVMAAFRERRHMGLVDFDDHLAEPELDWLGTPNVVRAECL